MTPETDNKIKDYSPNGRVGCSGMFSRDTLYNVFRRYKDTSTITDEDIKTARDKAIKFLEKHEVIEIMGIEGEGNE